MHWPPQFDREHDDEQRASDLRLQRRADKGRSQRADATGRAAQWCHQGRLAPTRGKRLCRPSQWYSSSRTRLLGSAEARKAAEDVVRFHFAGLDCLCLRCGALFDETTENQEGFSPG